MSKKQVQHIQDAFTVEVYESHCRVALLHVPPLFHHNKNDLNEFNRCQTQLRELYGQGILSAHVAEFTCYQLLYGLFAQQHVDTAAFLASLSEPLRGDPAVRTTLRICAAIRREDVPEFFRLFDETPPFACKHFMTLFFRRLRTVALYSLLNTWGIAAGISTESNPPSRSICSAISSISKHPRRRSTD